MANRWLAPLALLFAFATAPAAAGDDPAVARLALFLDAHGQQSGLPDEATSKAMRDYVSAGLDSDIAVARVAQAEFIHDHPDEKPPLIEGPLFNSSGYEPWTSYEIVVDPAQAVSAGVDGERRTLRVRYTDNTVTPNILWNDHYAMLYEQGAWRLDDVAYRAAFEYGNHGTLRAALRGEDEPATDAEPAAGTATPATEAADD